MQRFLCVSLCLGLMVSACKKKYTQEDLDAAKASARGTAVAKKNKEAVLKACLPQINSILIGMYGVAGTNNFFFRRNNTHNGTAEAPIIVFYTADNFPLRFVAGTTTGLGVDAATVTKNLNAMAECPVMQAQFVARTSGSGFRVHISITNENTRIAQPAVGVAPTAPAGTGLFIYERAALAIPGQQVHEVAAVSPENAAATDGNAGWHDCEVNDTTQEVTVRFTRAQFPAA